MCVPWAFGKTLLLLTFLGNAAGCHERMAPGLVIRLPQAINPETVMICSGIYGSGLRMSEVRTQEGIYDYPLKVDGADSLKLLIYCPGYKMVTAEFQGSELNGTKFFIPSLEPLPTTRLEGRLENSAHQPLPGRTLHLTYHLMEAMPYFRYFDGMVPMIKIATVMTGAEGVFTFEVPSFADDPFFLKYKGTVRQFDLSSRTEWSLRPDDTLHPHSFAVQSNYREPLVVMETKLGTLGGQLGNAFLRRHGLTGDLTPYIQSMDSIPLSISLEAVASGGRMSYNANLKPDGTFEVEVPPDTYDLNLLVMGPGFRLKEKIPVENGIVIQENQRQIVNLP